MNIRNFSMVDMHWVVTGPQSKQRKTAVDGGRTPAIREKKDSLVWRKLHTEKMRAIMGNRRKNMTYFGRVEIKMYTPYIFEPLYINIYVVYIFIFI